MKTLYTTLIQITQILKQPADENESCGIDCLALGIQQNNKISSRITISCVERV